MLTYILNQNFSDCMCIQNLREEVENIIIDALIQSDFNESEIEFRVKDISLFKFSSHLFSILAKRMEYIFHFNRENEIFVLKNNNEYCRYIFMNSLSEESNNEQSKNI